MLVHRHLDNVYAMNSEPTVLMALPLGPFYKLLKIHKLLKIYKICLVEFILFSINWQILYLLFEW